jgi:hypothetical protein
MIPALALSVVWAAAEAAVDVEVGCMRTGRRGT